MCATNTDRSHFFARWLEPGSSEPRQRRRSRGRSAPTRGDPLDRAEPDPCRAEGVVIEEKVAARSSLPARSTSTLPTLPELVVGWAGGRKSDAEVTCFINNIGLGYQFAAPARWSIASEGAGWPRTADRLVHRGCASMVRPALAPRLCRRQRSMRGRDRRASSSRRCWRRPRRRRRRRTGRRERPASCSASGPARGSTFSRA